MTETFPERLRQEIADLVGEPIDDVVPAKPGRIRFKHTHALSEIVGDVVLLMINANLCANNNPTHIRRRHRLLDLLMRWYDRYLDDPGHSAAYASLETAKAANLLKRQPELLDNDALTFDDILDHHDQREEFLAGYHPGRMPEFEDGLERRQAPLPLRPILWQSNRHRLEELTHPTHVLVEGKALRHALCTNYSKPWLEHAGHPPGTAKSAHCLMAWRMIEQQDMRLFSLAGRQGPLLTIPLITSHSVLGVMVGRNNIKPDGRDALTEVLIEALRALDEAVGPLFVAETALKPSLFARITAELPQLKAARHYASEAKITIRNPPLDA